MTAISEMTNPVECPNCGSTDSAWSFVQKNATVGVVNGRLRLDDVRGLFVLGCNECSETIKVTDGDAMAEALTDALDYEWSQQ